ncbi:MAG TPA: SDR family NAD(P)-dependent oxidoreductase [Euzebyales bacterium]
MGRFDGTVAMISGGARGMGASHARELAAEGASVVIGDVLDGEGKALAEEIGDAATFVHLDVTSSDDWTAAYATAEERYGAVNLLINNAGIVTFGSVEQLPPEDFRRIIDVNLTGTFLGMHHGVPSLRRAGGGVIINVSSTAGMMGFANIVGYVASKWGVRGMTKAAAMDVASDGIRVFSIHPGPIRTPMTADLGDELAAVQAIPRMGEPEEVSKLVMYLAADATYTTGAEFIIDGGSLLGQTVELPEA